jgi:hypothetical protein
MGRAHQLVTIALRWLPAGSFTIRRIAYKHICVFKATVHLLAPWAGMREYPLAGRAEDPRLH